MDLVNASYSSTLADCPESSRTLGNCLDVESPNIMATTPSITWMEVSEFLLQGVLLSLFAALGLVANIGFIWMMCTRGRVTPFHRSSTLSNSGSVQMWH